MPNVGRSLQNENLVVQVTLEKIQNQLETVLI